MKEVGYKYILNATRKQMMKENPIMNKFWILAVSMILLALPTQLSYAQDDSNNAPEAEATAEVIPLPAYYQLANVRYEPQGWNNCGPATITNALTFFGYQDNQTRAANWLKPNYEDKNVSPWQMAEFVNTQVPEMPVFAKVRVGGTIDLVRTLIANDFPLIIEKGYDPDPDVLGWMGHYLLVTGYDDAQAHFITHDSYIGPDTIYAYDYIDSFWQHFNYTYIVIYTADREAELNEILGSDADETQNLINGFNRARDEATLNQDDAFAWFNMGTNLVQLGEYENAAAAFDQARAKGLPWRMLWYQFGPFEAYYEVGRYDDMITLAQANLNDGGGQFVEETYYYGGLARWGKGEYDRAINNFNTALQFNQFFTPAQIARDTLQAQLNGS